MGQGESGEKDAMARRIAALRADPTRRPKFLGPAAAVRELASFSLSLENGVTQVCKGRDGSSAAGRCFAVDVVQRIVMGFLAEPGGAAETTAEASTNVSTLLKRSGERRERGPALGPRDAARPDAVKEENRFAFQTAALIFEAAAEELGESDAAFSQASPPRRRACRRRVSVADVAGARASTRPPWCASSTRWAPRSTPAAGS
ncbi:hypothetical protein SO694_00157012 [Aureococcus anophagefferens]|uniref:Uncharacterized protein n=1 Tax=Aureococcus anophagefferens TaxID=44056 RepID=A0ABR1G153_AURAN